MKRSSVLVMVLALLAFAFMAMGSGSSKTESKKVGEVEEASDEKSSGEESSEEKTAELKSEYHVGDVLEDGDLQIVYVASGEYEETNQFIKPGDGMKYVFLKLAFDNKGDKDESISFYSFEGYADGYSVDQHYTDDSVSATLSPGRTTEGTIIYEVPVEAQQIEVEYSVNFFTDEKIKFIYDGDKDSGYVAEAKTEASVDAYAVGDIVESSDLNITYLSCENDTSYSNFSKPADGCHYVTLTLEFENKGSSDAHISMYSFDCYADGKDCDQAYFRDDTISATLSAGRKAKGTVTFQVPDDASVVEAEYVSDMWTSSRVVFKVQ